MEAQIGRAKEKEEEVVEEDAPRVYHPTVFPYPGLASLLSDRFWTVNARYSPAYQASRERGKEWGKDSPVQLPVQERAAVMDGGVPSFCARPWIFARDDFPPFEADLMQESVCRKKERGRRSVGNVKCVH